MAVSSVWLLLSFVIYVFFPDHFALGIKELGTEPMLASSFRVMSIIGGRTAPMYGIYF